MFTRALTDTRQDTHYLILYTCQYTVCETEYQRVCVCVDAPLCQQDSLQCVAVCCSVLQCVTVCCSVMQYITAWHRANRTLSPIVCLSHTLCVCLTHCVSVSHIVCVSWRVSVSSRVSMYTAIHILSVSHTKFVTVHHFHTYTQIHTHMFMCAPTGTRHHTLSDSLSHTHSLTHTLSHTHLKTHCALQKKKEFSQKRRIFILGTRWVSRCVCGRERALTMGWLQVVGSLKS